MISDVKIAPFFFSRKGKYSSVQKLEDTLKNISQERLCRFLRSEIVEKTYGFDFFIFFIDSKVIKINCIFEKVRYFHVVPKVYLKHINMFQIHNFIVKFKKMDIYSDKTMFLTVFTLIKNNGK